MSFEIMLLVLLGAALHAIWNASVKAAKDKFLDATLILLGAAVIAPVFLAFLPLPSGPSWWLLVLSAAVHVLYFILVALSYEHGDMSVVYPLMRGTAPMFTAVLGMFLLDELPTTIAWLGIAFVCGGILSMAALSAGVKTVFTKGVSLALLNAGVIVLYTLIDGAGARASGNALSYTCWMFVLTALGVLTFASFRYGRALWDYFHGNRMKALAGGCCTFGSYSLALWAMTRAPIAHVATLRETSIVFGTILAVTVLKEQVSTRRILAIAAIAIGAVLVKLS